VHNFLATLKTLTKESVHERVLLPCALYCL